MTNVITEGVARICSAFIESEELITKRMYEECKWRANLCSCSNEILISSSIKGMYNVKTEGESSLWGLFPRDFINGKARIYNIELLILNGSTK